MNNALIQALLSGGAGGLMGMLGGQGVGGAVPPTGPGRPMPLNPGMMPPRVMPSMPAQPWGLHPMPIPGALPRPMPSIPWGKSGQPLNPRIMPSWGQPGQPQPAIPNMPNMPWGKPMPVPLPMPARPDMPGIPWSKSIPPGAGGRGMNNKGVLLDYINRIMQSNPNTGQPQY